jgi:hypothetical protein
LNPIKGDRKDANVTAFRSFLIELDVGTIKEQLGTITHLGMPFSAQIFSGNKSVHTTIVLDEDLKDEKTYRTIIEWIFRIVPLVDKNCINPSRCIRIPGAYRKEGKQRLINIGKRVTHKELFAWLNQYEHLRPQTKKKKEIIPGQANPDRLSPWCQRMLATGMEFKNGRNKGWFSVGVDFAKAGYEEEEAISFLMNYFQEEYDFKEKEFLTSIGSAFKFVREGK